MKRLIYMCMVFCCIAVFTGCNNEIIDEQEENPTVQIKETFNADNATVQVSGVVINAGKSVTLVYEYGTNADLLTKKSYTIAVVSNDTTFVTASIGGLTKSTKYYIRLSAIKEFGTFNSEVVSFSTTENATPVIASVKTATVAADGFQIEAEINPSNAASTFKVMYGTSLTNLSMQSGVSGTLTGSKAVKSTVSVTGLTPSTEYYYQVVATNPSGDRKSNVMLLKTIDGTVTDFEGNVYNTTKIGAQVWTTSNWACSKYADGTAIDSCFVYQNNLSNLALYGRLYTYEALKVKNIAPAGWRVPTKADWEKLIAYLGGESKSGNALKDVSFIAPGSTVAYPDRYNFKAIPSGMRNSAGTYFHAKEIGNVSWYAYYWGMTEENATEAFRVYITYVYDGCYGGKSIMKNAYSLRLIKE